MNALKNWWKVLSLSSSLRVLAQTEIKQFFSSPLHFVLHSRSTMTVQLWRTRKYNEMEILQMKTRQIRKVSFATNSQPLSSHPDKQLNLSLVHCSLIYKAQNTFHSLFTKYLSLTLIKSAKKKRLASSKRKKKENSSRRRIVAAKKEKIRHSFNRVCRMNYLVLLFISFPQLHSHRKGMLTDFVGIAALLELPSFLPFCQSRPNSNITSLFLSVFSHSNAHRVDLFYAVCSLQIFTPFRNVLDTVFENEKWQRNETYPRDVHQKKVRATLTPSGVETEDTEKNLEKVIMMCFE